MTRSTARDSMACTSCGQDAHVTIINLVEIESGATLIGADERLCMRCARSRGWKGPANPFAPTSAKPKGRARA